MNYPFPIPTEPHRLPTQTQIDARLRLHRFQAETKLHYKEIARIVGINVTSIYYWLKEDVYAFPSDWSVEKINTALDTYEASRPQV